MEESTKVLKQIIEALLFSAKEPLPFKKIVEIVEAPAQEVREVISGLKQEYMADERSIQIEEIAKGYQLKSKPIFAPYVSRLFGAKKQEKISLAASEVLAIIAYRQPITKQEIEMIRGVDSGQMMHTLLDRELVKKVGKKEVAGRPSLFATTQKFLIHFGLNSVKDLPKIKN